MELIDRLSELYRERDVTAAPNEWDTAIEAAWPILEARLRAAAEAIGPEWEYDAIRDASACPWCHGLYITLYHSPDCARGRYFDACRKETV